MTICILHGYLLEGSGSNLWTRAVAQALARAGRTVQLVCQEPHPEAYDFIAAAYLYEPDGRPTTLFERDVPYPGACVLHKPRLGDTLPVYVTDHYEEFARAIPMVALPDDEIEAYLARNSAVVERVVRERGVGALLANHAVLMSVVAERVADATGVPFAIMPHGSAIEYAVKQDPRFHALASGAFAKAARIFTVGREMRTRVLDTFPALDGIAAKLETLPLGVDTEAFQPAGRAERPARIAALGQAVRTLSRGRQPHAATRLFARLSDEIDFDALSAALDEARGYAEKVPDGDLERKLAQVDWAKDEILLFVGRLIAAKGLQSVIAALPLILEARPGARLVVVGHGPLREVMEALLWALERGARGLARNIAAWGQALEGGPARPLETVAGCFAALERRDELKGYFETARRTIRPDRVIFTGYLTHRELKHLLPCADAVAIPSIVPEAGPLVFLEAMAAGCLPLGTYAAGLAERIDAAAEVLPAEVAALMKLSADPGRTALDLAGKVPRALALGQDDKAAPRQIVVDRHDWTSIALKLDKALSGLGQP